MIFNFHLNYYFLFAFWYKISLYPNKIDKCIYTDIKIDQCIYTDIKMKATISFWREKKSVRLKK